MILCPGKVPRRFFAVPRDRAPAYSPQGAGVATPQPTAGLFYRQVTRHACRAVPRGRYNHDRTTFGADRQFHFTWAAYLRALSDVRQEPSYAALPLVRCLAAVAVATLAAKSATEAYAIPATTRVHSEESSP